MASSGKMTNVKFGNWQAFLDKAVADLVKEGKLEEYKKCSNNFQRVDLAREAGIVKSAPWISDYFTRCQEIKENPATRKSQKEAALLRQAGNRCFKSKQYDKATELYSKCIRNAPASQSSTEDSDSDLALGFANRSAALYHQGLYKECLRDIEQALSHGYPERLKHKVLLRQGQCYYQMKQFERAKSAFQETKEVLHRTTAEAKKVAVVEKELESWMNKVQKEFDRSSADQETKEKPEAKVHSSEFTIPDVCGGVNRVMVHATQAVELKVDEERGRHLVANSTLNPGDVLIVEKPYAAVLLPTHYHTHCHHCFTKTVAPLPCQHCTEVSYCSEACRQSSWSTYHHIECAYLDLLHSIGIAHLSLRIILTAGLDFLIAFRKDYVNSEALRTNPPGVSMDGTYKNDYLSVYELMPHDGDMQAEDLLQYTLTATLLLKCLENSNFFEEKLLQETIESIDLGTDANGDFNSSEKSCQLEPTKLYIGSLVLCHICQLVCNAHAITELELMQDADFSSVETSSQVRVATAIYPTTSLMNHSCDPTIISSFHNEILIVRVVKEVPPGGEIFNCYGPHCKRMGRAERQQHLKEQYFFDCTCASCVTEEHKENTINAFKCPECAGPMSSSSKTMQCGLCGHVTEVTNQIEVAAKSCDLFVLGLQQLENRNVKAAIKHLEHCLAMRTAVCYKHSKNLAEAQDALARCYAISGDFKKAAALLSESVKTTEIIYGDTSIELANELQKYADILVNIRDLKKAEHVVEKAIKLFSLNLGSRCSQVEELQEYRSMLNVLKS